MKEQKQLEGKKKRYARDVERAREREKRKRAKID